MGSSVSSFSGLTAANIATLFGTATSSSDSTAKDGTRTSAGVASGTPITGAAGGGTNAAKAIQAIVTQIQIEKMQTSVQGKVVSTLDSASIAVSYDKTVDVGSKTFSVDVTALNSVATATGNDTAGAVATLMTQVKAQEAQVEAAQNGVLFTDDQAVFGGRRGSIFTAWTANSVTLDMNETANRGLELSDEEDELNSIRFITGGAQQFQAQSTTGTSSDNSQTSASPGDAGSSSSISGANGSALYLQVFGNFEALAGKESQLVSDFLKGGLPGQNGTAPQAGDGFSYSDQGSEYTIHAVMMPNYDPTTLATFAALAGGPTAREQTAAMGGTVVGGTEACGQGWMSVIIPLKNS